MDITSNDINSISGCDSFIARLRRLKIQEGIFINNVRNSLLKCPDYKENNDHSNDLKLKMFFDNLKKSFIEIKNLFEDVKLKTHFQGTLEKYDIDELKRDITELETKIKLFKQYTQNELRTLQYEETVIKEKTIKNQAKLKIPVLPTKQYNEVVTSPVRVIINSPFKCLEVQRFQDFMKSSPNKYGGWNEYNHNIFVQIWKKYCGDFRMTPNHAEEPSILIDFKNEVLSKIPGLKPDDIGLHAKWYAEYLDVKTNQETALNRWKENRRKIKHPLREKKTEMSDGGNNNTTISTRQNILFAKEKLEKSLLDDELRRNSQTELRDTILNGTKQRFMKPTKQWINKRNSVEEVSFRNYDVDNITKLHTPSWRVNLKNNYIMNK